MKNILVEIFCINNVYDFEVTIISDDDKNVIIDRCHADNFIEHIDEEVECYTKADEAYCFFSVQEGVGYEISGYTEELIIEKRSDVKGGIISNKAVFEGEYDSEISITIKI